MRSDEGKLKAYIGLSGIQKSGKNGIEISSEKKMREEYFNVLDNNLERAD